MIGERRYPVPLSTHPDSPVHTPVIIIPGEPVKPEKRFLKTSISVDTDQQIITGLKISRYPIHDIPHAEKLLKLCHRTRRSDLYVMDKGYDSEEIHELIHDALNSHSLMPVRNRKWKWISGYYRKRIARLFDNEKYHQRNKAETVFYVMKRKFGEDLNARKYRLQFKEIKIKVIHIILQDC